MPTLWSEGEGRCLRAEETESSRWISRGSRARVNTALPENVAIDVETRFLDAPIMRAATVFGKDISKVKAPVNTIMEPKLYQLYLSDLKV